MKLQFIAEPSNNPSLKHEEVKIDKGPEGFGFKFCKLTKVRDLGDYFYVYAIIFSGVLTWSDSEGNI